MGFGIKELLVVLVIVLLLFGTKKLKNIGSDLGGAIKGFRKSMTDENEGDDKDADGIEQKTDDGVTIDATAQKAEK